MTTATLTLPDGSTKALSLYSDGEALEVRERNPGLPDAWGQGWTPGAPVTFDHFDVVAPGYTLLAGGLYGAKLTATDTYQIAGPQDFKYPARRNGVELWPGTETHHRILPSDTLYLRLVPADDPWEIRMLAREVTQDRRDAALSVIDFDEARIARWPWLQKVLGWYRYDASSGDIATPAGQRNVGWLLVPKNFMQRWGPNPGGLPAIQHWYGLGTRQAGVSLTNEHYGSEAAWIGQGLRQGDPYALTVGLYLLRQKIAYGLIDCDAACPHKGKWRTESGDMVRGTSAMVPSWAKEWDRGLAATAALLPNDTFIQRGAKLRQDYLLGAGHEWDGAGGARNIGHYLENLLHWGKATGDARFHVKAASELSYAMTKVGALDYFPENPGSPYVSAGEGLLALAMARRIVFELGFLPALKPKLDAMLNWALAHLWDPNTGRCGYFYQMGTGLSMSGHFQGVFWMQLDLPPATRGLIEQYMFTHYANRTDVDACFGGEGPGWEKHIAFIATSGATR